MKKNRFRETVIVLFGIVASFIFGVLVVEHEIFPYQFLGPLQKQTPTPVRNPKRSDHYFHRTSFFMQHSKQQYDVVFIGDSITESAEWSELFPAVNSANRGISGDTSDGVLERLDHISAKKAFVMIGVNDIAGGADVSTVFNNYRKIVEILTAKKIEVFVQSTVLTNNESWNVKITELNTLLQDLSEKSESVTFIDLNVHLKKGSLLDPRYSRDGVHLNGEAYAVWKKAIEFAVAR